MSQYTPRISGTRKAPPRPTPRPESSVVAVTPKAYADQCEGDDVPKYVVKPESDYPMALEAPKKGKKRYPSVTIPVSPEIIKALKVDGPVVVELKGTVRSLESRQSADSDPYMNRNELRIEVRQV